MMARPLVSIEGDEELTRKLAALEAKMQRSVLTKAAKAAGKVVKEEYQARVPVLTGAMRASVGVKVRRYRHKVGTGKIRTTVKGERVFSFEVKRVKSEDIGASIFIDPKRLKKQVGRRATGAVRFNYVTNKKGKAETRVFYYPSIVELGGRQRKGERPLTKALYTNTSHLRDIYIGNLRALVAAAGGLS